MPACWLKTRRLHRHRERFRILQAGHAQKMAPRFHGRRRTPGGNRPGAGRAESRPPGNVDLA